MGKKKLKGFLLRGLLAAALLLPALPVLAAANLQNMAVSSPVVAGDEITVSFEVSAQTAGEWVNADIVFSADSSRELGDDAVLTSAGAYDADFSPPDTDGHTGMNIMQPVDNAFYPVQYTIRVPASYSGNYHVFVAVRETQAVELSASDDLYDAVSSATMDVTQPTATHTLTPTMSYTETHTLTHTLTPTMSHTETHTLTHTLTPTMSHTETHTLTCTPTWTNTENITSTYTPSRTPITTGEGTALIYPGSAAAGTSGNTITLEYTAGTSLWTSGVLRVTIPAGWSAPSLAGSNPGFCVITVSGGTYAGNMLDAMDIYIYVNNLNADTGKITIIYGAKTGGGPGATAQPSAGTAVFGVYMNPVSEDVKPISSMPQVSVSLPTPTPTVTRTHTASPTNSPTFTATPTVTMTATQVIGEGYAALTPVQVLAGSTGNTIIIEYTAGPTAWAASPGFGTLAVVVPAGWSPPSINPSDAGYFAASSTDGEISGTQVSGTEMRIFVAGLTAGGKVYVTYGSKSMGGPGAAAQASYGNAYFTVKTDTDGTQASAIAISPYAVVEAATATPTRTITPTYTATPDNTPQKPQGMSALSSGNNLEISWNNSAGADFYRIYRATGPQARFYPFPSGWSVIATVLPTPAVSSFTDSSGLVPSYYLVTGVNGAGEGKPGQMAEKSAIGFTYTAGSSNSYRVSLPYVTQWVKASDIVLAVEGSLSTTPSRIDRIAIWNPAGQNFSVFGWQAGVNAWIGNDFAIDAGTISSNAVYLHSLSVFSLPIAGLSKEQPLFFKYNPDKANANKRCLPYSSAYHKASDIVIDIEGGTGPGTNTKINRLAVWDVPTQSYKAYGYSAGSGWIIGTDFDIVPGDAINIYLSGNTSSFTWMPRLSLTPVP